MNLKTVQSMYLTLGNLRIFSHKTIKAGGTVVVSMAANAIFNSSILNLSSVVTLGISKFCSLQIETNQILVSGEERMM